MPAFWKKILVPVDFSDDSLAALAQARSIHQADQTDVILLHVTEPAYEGLRIHTTELHHRMDETARQQLQALAKEHFPLSQNVSVIVKEGRAGDVICETAQSCAADVIIIATHGISGVKHFLLGSVTEKVVRHARCSVLVVR